MSQASDPSSAPDASRLPPRESRRTLYVTEDVLVATWRAFADGAGRKVESTVRWAVPRAMARTPLQVVTAVITPRQRVSGGYFEVPYEGTRAMGQVLVDHDLVNVAQVHTHPGHWVGHSPWDDSHAFSSREGALSIIWPNYGSCLPHVTHWGIHERRTAHWEELRGAARDERVVLLRSRFDLSGGSHELAVGRDGDEVLEDQDVPAPGLEGRTRPGVRSFFKSKKR